MILKYLEQYVSMCALFVFLCAVPGSVFAALPEGSKAGAVEKEVQEAYREKIIDIDTKDSPILEEFEVEDISPIIDSKKILVKDFSIKGNTVISEADLFLIVSSYIGKELSFTEISQVIALITSKYREQGYFLANAYIPEQEITDGIVKVDVIEGSLGGIIVEGARHYNKKFIKSHFNPTIKGVLNYNQLIKSLLLLNEYVDLNVRAVLEKGDDVGTANVILEVTDTVPIDIGVDYNNFGTKYVSRKRESVNLKLGNFGVPGSQFSVRTILGSPTDTLLFSRYEYKIPLNSHNSKLAFSYLRSGFEVRDSIVGFESEGKTDIFSLMFLHPLIRTHKTAADFSALFDYASIENYQLQQLTSDDELRILRLGYMLDHVDNFKGRSYMDLKLSLGMDEMMGASRDDSSYQSRAGAGSDFVKGNLDAFRLQKLPFGMFLYMKFAGQMTDTSLPVFEEMSIGGANSVRGYSQSEYLGDYGYSTTLELRMPVPFISENRIFFTDTKWKDFLQLAAFFDHGGVYTKSPGVGEPKDEFIRGGGFGFRVKLPYDFNLNVDYAFPLGKEPINRSNDAVYVQVSKSLC